MEEDENSDIIWREPEPWPCCGEIICECTQASAIDYDLDLAYAIVDTNNHLVGIFNVEEETVTTSEDAIWGEESEIDDKSIMTANWETNNEDDDRDLDD